MSNFWVKSTAMSKLFLSLSLILFSSSLFAQQKKLSVVWDLSSADTLVQAAVFRQINNARALEPNLDIEVVFHGNAVKSLLLVDKTFEARVKAAKEKGVTIAVCNNSLKRLNISPSELMTETTVVPSAVVELIKKQADGWSYLRAAN
jgi:intracellular sulfur oxidation DsrE/DsrF family protein